MRTIRAQIRSANDGHLAAIQKEHAAPAPHVSQAAHLIKIPIEPLICLHLSASVCIICLYQTMLPNQKGQGAAIYMVLYMYIHTGSPRIPHPLQRTDDMNRADMKRGILHSRGSHFSPMPQSF